MSLFVLGVVAFAVDGGYFTACRAEIHRELTAMMDGMTEAKIEERDGWHLDHAAEIHFFGEMFTG
jgi:hypothetical protein